MPKPQFFRNLAIIALLLGVGLLGGNFYFDVPGHRTLAKVCFIFAIVCEFVFAIAALLWVLCSAWVREPERKAGPMPGGMMPGGTMPGGTMPGGMMPGGMKPGGPQPGAPAPGAQIPGLTLNTKPRPPQS